MAITTRFPGLAAFLCLLGSGCVGSTAAQDEVTSDPYAPMQWHRAEQPAAVVMVTHGFNLDPRVMEEMAVMLQESGLEVLRHSLTGHDMTLTQTERVARFARVEFSTWQRDMDEAVEVARARARELDKPLYLLGFSLGGLLSADLVNRRADVDVERAVLLAPALSLRWTSWLLRPLGVLPNFLLPNVGPERYQANEYASVSAYEALYDGVEQFRQQADPGRLNIPALVLVHPMDELVSDSGLEDFIARRKLTQWELVRIDKSEDAASVLNHIIVDPKSMGDSAWRSLRRRLRQFLTATD